MKKKIIGVAIMAAIALGAGWNIVQSENEVDLSDLALNNVEALANGENPFLYATWRVVFQDLWNWTCYNEGSSYCPYP